MDPQLTALMQQTITIAPNSGFNAQGEPTWGTPVSYQCRIVSVNRVLRGTDGQEQAANTAIFLKDSPVLSIYDKVTLPDGQTPVIFTIDSFPDEFGRKNIVLYTGFSRQSGYSR